MYRFVLVLCLVLLVFDLRVDSTYASACVHVRTLPQTAAGWCVRAPTLLPPVTRLGTVMTRFLD